MEKCLYCTYRYWGPTCRNHKCNIWTFTFGIKLKPTYETISKLRNKLINLNGLEDQVAKVVSKNLLTYNNDWHQVDKMLDELMSTKFETTLVHLVKVGFIIGCMDHVGFDTNPRNRTMGFHKIFDHYVAKLENSSNHDGMHFHHHPVSFNKAHISATHFFHTLNHFWNSARRIIEESGFL